MPASGTGANGVLLVGEAGGEHEAAAGEGFVGKAGHFLFQQLKRVGIERDSFKIANVLSCRPPENKLAGMPYELSVIASCTPLLDATIETHYRTATAAGRHPVILTLGKVAFKRIMGYTDKSPEVKTDYLAYPHWSEHYNCWVLAADHPSYLMRGNHHLVPVLQYTFQRALEIARDGIVLDKHPNYLLDPLPLHFSQWASEYLRNPEQFTLSYDIETPHKDENEEDAARAEGEEDDYTILRVSFCFKPGRAASVPWTAPYQATIQALMGANGPHIGWNNRAFDDPRILVHMPIGGERLDGMVAWHVLNSALPKGLGFVTPFYWKTSGMWKHLSNQAPAFYNAKDSDAALRNWLGIKADLKANNQWEVFERHSLKVNRVFDYMSAKGVLRDEALRTSAEQRLTILLDAAEAQIEQLVPLAAKKEKVYKSRPRNMEGVLERTVSGIVKVCSNCGLERPKKPHFRILKKVINPCATATVSTKLSAVVQCYKVLPWKISKVGLISYQKAVHHQPVFDRRTKILTFDETALIKLQKRYPKDQLYPLILEFRGNQKLRSVYVGVTERREVTVQDDYILQPGEKFLED